MKEARKTEVSAAPADDIQSRIQAKHALAVARAAQKQATAPDPAPPAPSALNPDEPDYSSMPHEWRSVMRNLNDERHRHAMDTCNQLEALFESRLIPLLKILSAKAGMKADLLSPEGWSELENSKHPNLHAIQFFLGTLSAEEDFDNYKKRLLGNVTLKDVAVAVASLCTNEGARRYMEVVLTRTMGALLKHARADCLSKLRLPHLFEHLDAAVPLSPTAKGAQENSSPSQHAAMLYAHPKSRPFACSPGWCIAALRLIFDVAVEPVTLQPFGQNWNKASPYLSHTTAGMIEVVLPTNPENPALRALVNIRDDEFGDCAATKNTLGATPAEIHTARGAALEPPERRFQRLVAIAWRMYYGALGRNNAHWHLEAGRNLARGLALVHSALELYHGTHRMSEQELMNMAHRVKVFSTLMAQQHDDAQSGKLFRDYWQNPTHYTFERPVSAADEASGRAKHGTIAKEALPVLLHRWLAVPVTRTECVEALGGENSPAWVAFSHLCQLAFGFCWHAAIPNY